MRQYKVALIGTGGRSVCYAQAYAAAEDIEVVAVADPLVAHRQAMAARSGLSNGFAEYDRWEDLLAEQTALDGVVINTPNHLHAHPAIACLQRGLPVALEKPLASTQADCERILDAERANHGRTLIGFVLRSTPFYAKIHELIAGGALGKVVSIQADELPGLTVTSIMSRSPWRRRQELGGGAILEKSCHDMDVLNWMMGGRPVSLTSYGGVRMFRPDPSLPQTCEGCRIAERCAYNSQPALSGHEDRGEAILHQFVREDSRCIYTIDKSIVDVQSVAIEYETGAVANFLMNFGCVGPKAGRNFHAIGTAGRIWGNLGEQTVHVHDNAADTTTEFDASGDGSGHGGGDRRHAMMLHRMMADPDYRPDCNAAAGYLSAVMCFAADRSRTTRRRVELRYDADGRARII